MGSIGETPDKPISEGLFLQFLQIVEGRNRAGNLSLWSFYRQYRGGPLINVFLRVYFWSFCRQQRVVTELVIYLCGVFIGSIGGTPSNRGRNLCFWSFYRQYRGGPLINVFLRVYFWSFCIQQSVVTELVIYVFGVFIGFIGGTPDKCIHGCLI